MDKPTTAKLFKWLTSALIQLEKSGQDIEGTIASGEPFSIVLGLITDPTKEPEFIGILVAPEEEELGATYTVTSTIPEDEIADHTDKFFMLVGWFPDDKSTEPDDLMKLIDMTASAYQVPADVMAAMKEKLIANAAAHEHKKPHLSVVPKRLH